MGISFHGLWLREASAVAPEHLAREWKSPGPESLMTMAGLSPVWQGTVNAVIKKNQVQGLRTSCRFRVFQNFIQAFFPKVFSDSYLLEGIKVEREF